MKKIAIISAMDLEVNPLIETLKAKKIENYIWKTQINNIEVFIMISGIGKSNIAHAITYLNVKFNIDNFLNIGVAGSVSNGLNPLDLLVASRVAHHDFDLRKFGYKMGQVPKCELFFVPNLKIFNNIISGEIVSGDKFITINELEKVKTHFKNAVAVDMESASFGQVASKLDVKWTVLRIISDNGKDLDNIKQYQENKLKASQHLNSKIIEAIEKL